MVIFISPLPIENDKNVRHLIDYMAYFRHSDYVFMAKTRVVEWRRRARFPAKMTRVHVRALTSTEKISYS